MTFETVYEELKELNIEVADSIKHHNLLANLGSVASTESKFLTHHCRENFSTFDECLTHLKMYSSRQDGYALEKSKRQAILTHIKDYSPMTESTLDMETLSPL